jgi:hypothetical protein
VFSLLSEFFPIDFAISSILRPFVSGRQKIVKNPQKQHVMVKKNITESIPSFSSING